MRKQEKSRERALFSCYDKTGIETLAESCLESGFDLIASSGSYRYLRNKNLEVVSIEEISPLQGTEYLSKTLQHCVHEGFFRQEPDYEARFKITQKSIPPIGLVCSNLYPLKDFTSDDALARTLEWVDVGGPALLTNAIRNYQSIFVLTCQTDYEECSAHLSSTDDDKRYRKYLASKAAVVLHEYYSFLNRHFIEGEINEF